MNIAPFGNLARSRCRSATFGVAALLAIPFATLQLGADEPYARNRDYDLEHSRIALRFDLDQKKVMGDVTHTLTILHDATSKIVFDSAGLTIHSATLNKSAAKFEIKDDKLIIPLTTAAHAGEKFDITIRYEGKPTKGLYFILPTRITPTVPSKSGPRASPRTRATTFRPTTIPMTASPPKRSSRSPPPGSQLPMASSSTSPTLPTV